MNVKFNLQFLFILILALATLSCDLTKKSQSTSSLENDLNEDVSPLTPELVVEQFIQTLKKQEPVQNFFSDDWSFNYLEYNRCDGTTIGNKLALEAPMIDNIIELEVNTDGKGWLCDETAPSTSILQFSLAEHLKKWDRIELADYETSNEKIFHIEGAGESDYIEIQLSVDSSITRLNYYSEDPG